MSYVYEENADNMNIFFKTSQYKELKANLIKEKSEIGKELVFENNRKDDIWLYCIKTIINNGFFSDGTKIYKDPDIFDENLYEYVKEMMNKNNDEKYLIKKEKNRLIQNNIRFSLDCVIGWKAIMDTYYRENKFINNEKEFVEIYKIIRNPENAGHLLWPVYQGTTINTERYKKFNDRIDYTLYDIKNYFNSNFDNDNLKLKKAYANTTTKKWLDSFKCNNDSQKNFDNFIAKMHLERWCKIYEENGQHYEIIDLSSENINSKIEGYLCNEETYDAQKEYQIDGQYIKNLIEIIKKSPQ